MEQQIQALRQQLSNQPSNRDAFNDLISLLTDSAQWLEIVITAEQYPDLADWDEIISSLDALAETVDDSAIRSDILLAMGEVSEKHLRNLSQAVRYYQQSFKSWKQNDLAIAAARRIFYNQGKFDMAVKLLELELRTCATSASAQGRLLREMAKVQGFDLGQRDDALRTINQAIERDPHPEALAILRALSEGLPLEAVLKPSSSEIPALSLVKAAPTDEASDDEVPVDIAEEPADDAPAASDEAPAATDEAPAATDEAPAATDEAPAATDEAPAASDEAPAASDEAPAASDEAPAASDEAPAASDEAPAASDEAPAASDEAPAASGEAPAASDEAPAASDEAPAASDEAPAASNEAPAAPKDTRKPWEAAVDKLVEQANAISSPTAAALRFVEATQKTIDADPSSPRASELIQRALELAPTHPEVLKLSIQLHETNSRWSAAAAGLETLINATAAGSDRVALQARLAFLLNDHLHQPDRATSIAQELIDADPLSPDALHAAEIIFHNNWADLISLYEEALKKLRRKPNENEVLTGLATMVWRRVGDLKEAEKYFKRLKLADAKNVTMLEFYCDFYEAEADWNRLLPAIQAFRSAITDPKRELALSFKMAEVAEVQLQNPAKAIDVWKSILRSDASNAPARAALAELYERTEKWTALIEILKENIDQLPSDDAQAKVDILFRLVEIYRDRMRLDMKVIETFNAILELSPNHPEATDALIELYEKTKRWNELLATLLNKAQASQDTQDAISIYWRIADIYRTLNNTSKAIEAFEKIVELDPSHADSLRELHSLYEKRGNWTNLYDILGKEALLAFGDERVSLFEQQAALAERQMRSQPDKIISAWESVSQAADEPHSALEKLEELYKKQEDFTALASVYERLADLADDDDVRIKFLNLLAQVHIQHLDDEPRAIQLWLQILDLDDDDGNELALSQITNVHKKNEAWDDLVSLYAARDAYEDLYEILSDAADDLYEEDQQIIIYQRMAQIAAEHLDDDQVISAYESILELDETHVETARALLPYYRKHQDFENEARANQIILEWTADPSEKLPLIREIARLFEENLSDLKASFDWYGQAIRLAPSEFTLREHYEDLASRANTLDLLVSLYKSILSPDLDPSTSQAILRVVARSSQDHLSDIPQAIHFWEQILALDPSDPETINALETLYASTDAWDNLLSILDRKLSLPQTLDDDARISLLFKRASTLELHLNRLSDAASSYADILSLDPQNLDAVRGLKTIYAQEERWDALSETLQKELDLTSDDRASILLELGSVNRNKLSNISDAVDWYSLLLDESPNHPDAISQLNDLLDTPERARVASILEQVYRLSDSPEDLVRILEIRLESISSPADRADLLWEIFSLRKDRLSLLSDSFETAVRIFQLDFHDQRAWDELEAIADITDTWEMVADLYNTHRPSPDDASPSSSQLTLLRRLALIYETHLYQDAQARPCWETLRAQDPADLEPIDHLETIYLKLEALPELVSLLLDRAQLSSTPDPDRVSLFFRAADILEQNLDNPSQAIDAYQRVRAIDDANPQAIDALTRLYQQLERWDDLVSLIQQHLDFLSDIPARHATLFLLGQTLDTHKHDLQGAIDAYSETLQQDPSHPPTRDASEALLIRLSTASEPASDLPSLRTSLCDLLEPIFDSEDAHEKLVNLLRIRLSDTQSPDDRVELNARAARLLRDQLARYEDAFLSFRDAISARFDDEPLRAEFEALAEGLDAWDRVISLYTQGCDALEDEPLRLLRTRIAQIYQDELKQPEQAISAWRAVLSIEGEDAQALDALEALYENSEQWAPLVDALRRKLVIASDQVALLRKIASVEDIYLHDTPAAIRSYNEILSLLDGDPDALQALETLYQSTKNWEDLVRVYRDMVRTEPYDAARQRDLFFKMAHIYEQNLDDPQSAIGLYRRSLDLPDFSDDLQALDALDHLFLKEQDFPELDLILKRKLDLAASLPDQDALRFRIGQINQLHLGLFRYAIDYYRDILDHDAQHSDAISALRLLLDDESFRLSAAQVLEDVYARRQDFAALDDVLERQLLDIADVDAQLDLLSRIATQRQTLLNNFNGAFDAWARALNLNPSSADYQAQLETLAELTSDYARLVSIYKDAVENVSDPDRAVELDLRIADLLRDALDNPSDAEAFYRRALERQPDNARALDSLDSLYETRSDWDNLLSILDEKLLYEPDADNKISLLFRSATILRDRCNDPSRAIETLRRVIDELQPFNVDAISSLKNLYRSQSLWADLVDLLNHELNYASSPSAIASIKLDLARVFEAHIHDDAEAVRTYNEILELDEHQDHLPTIEALESLFSQSRELLSVSLLLEPIYRRRGDAASLIPTLEVRILNEYDPFSRAHLLTEVMDLWESLNQPAQALSVAGRRFLEQPSDPDARNHLSRLAQSLNQLDTWSDLLQRALDGDNLSDPDARLDILQTLANLCERLQNLPRAEALYEEILLDDPNHALSLQRLEAIHTHNENWDALIKLFERRVDQSPSPDDQAALLSRIAQTHEALRADFDASIDALQRILDLNLPDADAPTRDLERLLRHQSRFDELADLYRREISSHSDRGDLPRVVHTKHLLAQTLVSPLRDIPEAINVWRETLDIDPLFAPARHALEALMASLSSSEDPDERAHQLPISQLLEAHYDEASDWQPLVLALDIQLSHLDDPFDRLAIFNKQARILEAFDADLNRAFSTRSLAFLEQPSNPDSRAELERVASASHRVQDLIPIYRDALPNCDDGYEQVRILLRTADLERDLGNLLPAIDLYAQALDAEPDNAEPLDALIDLYNRTQNYPKLVESLSSKAEASADLDLKKRLYFSIAQLWETHLDDRSEAIHAFRSVLDADPQDPTAISSLERLYQAAEAWPDLIDTLNTHLSIAQSLSERTQINFAIASIYDSHLSDPSEAIRAYETILADVPADPTANASLDRLFTSEERWNDLADLLRAQLSRAEDSGDSSTMNSAELRLAHISESNLGDTYASITHLRNILSRDIHNADALSSLSSLLSHDDYLDTISAVLDPVLSYLQRWDALIDLYERKLPTLFNPEEQRDLLLRITALLRDQLSDPARAFARLSSSFAPFAADELATSTLHSLASTLDAWPALIQRYEQLIDDSSDNDLSINLCQRTAALHEQLGDLPAAIDNYRRILDLDSLNADALSQLYRLYQAQSQWRELASVIESLIDVYAADRDQVLVLRYQLGQIKESEFKDIPSAIQSYKEILWDDTTNPDALAALERLVNLPEHCIEISETLDNLYVQWESWAKLADLIHKKLAVTDDPDDRISMLRRLARISLDNLSNYPQAFDAFSQALSLDPADGSLVSILEDITQNHLQNWDALAQSLSSASKLLSDPEAQRDLDLKVGHIYLQHLQQLEPAEATYKAVLDREPDNLYALKALEYIYGTQQRFSDLLSIYDLLAEHTFNDADRVQILFQAAQIALSYLAEPNPPKAISCFRRVLEIDPSNDHAFSSLEQLLEHSQAWDDLIALLEQRALQTPDAFPLHVKISQISQDHLNDLPRAIDALRAALDVDPSSLPALRSLEVLFDRTSQLDELQQVVMQQLDLTTDPSQQIALNLKAADLALNRFNDPHSASERLQAILSINPSHPDALSLLESIYLKQENYWDLVEIFKKQRQLVSDPNQALQLDIKIARIAGSYLGDIDTAIHSLEQVLQRDPSNAEAMSSLSDLYDQRGDAQNALQMLNSLLHHTDPNTQPDACSNLYVRIALLLQKYSGDESQVESALQGALQYNPSNIDAADALIDIYTRRNDLPNRLRVSEYKALALTNPSERFSSLLDIVRSAALDLQDGETASRNLENASAAAASMDDDAHFDALKQLADLASKELQNQAWAASFLERASALRPSDLDLSEQLLSAFIDSNDLDRARPMLDSIISQLEEQKLRKRLPPFLHRRAQLATASQDPALAISSLEAALSIDPSFLPAQLDLGKYHFSQENWTDALKVFQKMLLNQANINEKQDKVDLFFYLGMVRVQTGDKARAKDMFKRALTVDPNHTPSQDALNQLG
jgi:golgin subfamily B member 1